MLTTDATSQLAPPCTIIAAPLPSFSDEVSHQRLKPTTHDRQPQGEEEHLLLAPPSDDKTVVTEECDGSSFHREPMLSPRGDLLNDLCERSEVLAGTRLSRRDAAHSVFPAFLADKSAKSNKQLAEVAAQRRRSFSLLAHIQPITRT